MNVGDLVKISQEISHSRRPTKNVWRDIGIIIDEYQTAWHLVDVEGVSETGEVLPELYYYVYNFSERTVLVYNAFEMKILNKAPRDTSNIKEEY